MTQDREIIYGVCDKTGNCDSYYGFFKNEDDAKKEIQIQTNRLKEDLGMLDIVVKGDRAVILKDNRAEELVIVIHRYVVR
jgi:hypothetical protein